MSRNSKKEHQKRSNSNPDSSLLFTSATKDYNHYRIEVNFSRLHDYQLTKLKNDEHHVLLGILTKIIKLFKFTLAKAVKEKYVEIYDQYPLNSDFTQFPKPKENSGIPNDAKWGRIEITNRYRLPCHFVFDDNRRVVVLFVVFIDPKHQWCLTEKKKKK